MGRRRRHTPEQVIRKLREADRLLGEGQDVAAVAKQLEVSEPDAGNFVPDFVPIGAHLSGSSGVR